VATSVGFVPNIIKDDITGILIPSENKDALADAIKKMIRDPLLRQRTGAAARELIAAEYSAKRMTEEYLALYEQVVAERSNNRQ
jgi:glycosyltransferase involved in cell wall biosynthesis